MLTWSSLSLSWSRFEGSHPNPEADPDLVASPGGKPTTPRDTREQGAQYNRQATALRPKQPEAAGRRRGMQLQCNVVWKCSSQTLALPHTAKVTPAFSVHHRQRWGDDGTHHTRTHHTTDSTTQWTWGSLFSSPMVATAYSLSLSPTREYGGECSCEARIGATMRVHSVSRGWSAVQYMTNGAKSCV